MERWFALAVVVVATAAGSAGATRPRAGSAGVTIAVPTGWHTWVPPGGVAGNVTDPLTRIVAVSAPFRFAACGCQVAAYAFPGEAVALVVVEWIGSTPGTAWPPRPHRFTRTTLPLHPPPSIECFDGPGGSAQFADHGRRFGAYILIGRRASPALADRARHVLDTLRVNRRR